MMQLGFIGTGSMGSILIDAFIASKSVLPNQIIAHNRTPAKAIQLAERYPGLVVARDNAQVVENSQVVLLCVKPSEYQQALADIASLLTRQHLLITIASPIKLAELEELLPCPVARVIPSITNAARSGLTLCEFGTNVTEEIRQTIFTLFSEISSPIEVPGTFVRVSADLSSCGPAFVSYLLQQMIAAASEETGISVEAATYITSQMVIGMAELLKQEIFTLTALEERVCVPKGITGEGLIPLKERIPGVFNEVFRRTQMKFAEDMEETSLQLKA